MKLALLADVHSNYVALEACLKYISDNAFDGICFLGDYVTDCPYPQNTIRLLKEIRKYCKVWFIQGNREEYMLLHHVKKFNWEYSSRSGSLLYTYENLTSNDIEFFAQMPIYSKVSMKGYPPFGICHGSPRKLREGLHANSPIADEYLSQLDCNYLFCAHSHRPFRYHTNGKTLINCASVGESVNGQTDAQFVSIEYTDGVWVDSLISVPYNIGRVIQEFRESGIYDKAFLWAKCIVRLLQTGENIVIKCLKRAECLAQENDDNLWQSDIAEMYWQQAAQEINIE